MTELDRGLQRSVSLKHINSNCQGLLPLQVT